MFSKNNRQMNDKKQGEIITRYTIKKFSFGAASVAVACGIYFANGATADAQDYSGLTSSVDYEVVAEASDQSLAPEVKLNQASEVDGLASTDQGSDPIESGEKLREEESLNEPQASSVTVVRVDRNGRKVTAQYVPTVVPVLVAPSEPELERQGLIPATGEAPDYSFFSGVALTILASVGLVATRKRQATEED